MSTKSLRLNMTGSNSGKLINYLANKDSNKLQKLMGLLILYRR